MNINHHWRVTFPHFKQVLEVKAHDGRRAKEQAMKALRDRDLIPAPQTYEEVKLITALARASRVRQPDAPSGTVNADQ